MSTLDWLAPSFGKPDDVAIIRWPIYCDRYISTIADYLARVVGQNMDVRATPQSAIVDLAFSRKCRLREIHEHPGRRTYVTNLFAFQQT